MGGEGSAARPGKFMGTLKVSFAGSPATVEGAVQKHNQGFFGRLRDAFAGQ